MDTPSVNFAALRKTDLERVHLGGSSKIFRIRNTNIVAKISPTTFPSQYRWREWEKEMYDRIGTHPHILRYLGQSPPSCRPLNRALLFEYHPKGNAASCIDEILSLPPRQRRRQQYQAASALAYIHSLDIVHGDVALNSFLLRENGDIVLCGFSRSCLFDGRGNFSSACGPSFPAFGDVPSKQGDVRGLGIVLRQLGYEELPSEVLDALDMDLRVLQECWDEYGYTAAKVAKDLVSSS
ncbi:hypothetical protein SAPIO_CDS8325 [Scedosporium apiospermum]|uniref:Protein kinase domain-containing protein n=1 Tax=Pseudallescheria apiosperma TaxID=563466 RepID=A0A084FZD4_PSEDA|nr:uncharacterized protein SAPIO_CDS8325 [Scedosporium apiospermum]KEZ40446.1 hypothetical protein SAPIO_CDS8325 [Scedosporium apiospermum]